jgi:tetratricopeptide (TPR) repeat protein
MQRVTAGGLGLLVWLLASPAWSAATLAGVVSLLREHGQPARGVEIFARGANPVTTGDDGLFTLMFPQGHPGQDVRVGGRRAGWDVVNDILLDQRLPDTSSARALEIIICPSAEREQRVAEFYRLKGSQAVEVTYRTKLAELEARQAATAQERDRSLRERDQALAQVQEWARQAAARKPDEVGGTHREALRLFVEGKADAALQLLSDDRLQQEADKAKDHADARKQYAEALDLRRALAKRNPDAYLPYVANTLNNLGQLSRAENRNADARKQFEQALDIFRQFAARAPATYQPRVQLVEDFLRELPK